MANSKDSFFTFTESRGFVGEDKDVRIDDIDFVRTQFQKKDSSGNTTPVGVIQTMLKVDITVLEPDDPAHATATQLYPVGFGEKTANKIFPSLDGEKRADSGGYLYFEGEDGPSPKSNYAEFFAPLLSLGVDPNVHLRDNGGVRALKGAVIHLTGKLLPKRKDAKADDLAPKILVPNAIRSFPWDKPGAGAGAGASANKGASAGGGSAAASSATPELLAKSTEYLNAVLASKSPVGKVEATKTIFNKLAAKDADRMQIAAIVADDAFLGELSAPWNYDPATSTLSKMEE